jgi:hypothetical protein
MKTYLITYQTWRSEQHLAIHSTDAEDPQADFKEAGTRRINRSHIVPISSVEIESETTVRVPVIVTAMGNVFTVELLVEDLPRPRTLVVELPEEVAAFVRSNGGEAVYTVECNVLTGWYRHYEDWRLLGDDQQG